VSTITGPGSVNFLPMRNGVQLWAKWVNSRGGAHGHEIQIITADNGGDPARNKAVTRDLVERQGVIAFIQNADAISGPSAKDYLEAKRIPVIGLSGGESWAYDSPMYFPQMTSGIPYGQTIYASIAQQAVPQGKTNLGIIGCTEIQLCRDISNMGPEQAQKHGMSVVYRSGISLAQPDFTAECLAARNAGAQVFFVIGDGNTLSRGAASCARQGYHPLFATGNLAVLDDMKNNPNLDGALIANSSTFLYFQPGGTAAEYQEAKARFGEGIPAAGGVTVGWVSGKLFERASATLGEPPTSDQLLKGLWSIKNDDLDGLTAPLTFTENQKPAPVLCWYNMMPRNGAWQSPNEFQRTCE
jgi:branched-chain amino acid transport system substrate-binding protein